MTDLQPVLLIIDVRITPDRGVVVHPCAASTSPPPLASRAPSTGSSLPVTAGSTSTSAPSGSWNSSGLAVAARATRVLAALGGAVTISHATGRVRRLFDLVGAGHLLVGPPP